MNKSAAGGRARSPMQDCVFCRIVAGEIPAAIVHRDETVVAFRDINPVAPTHILLVPREHIPDLRSDRAADGGLWEALMRAIQRLAQAEGVADGGFRIVVNTGAAAGQTVPHLHLHLLGGGELKAF
ncbi:MAG: histidine triad nucleotide-binding protein [Patescibacteria group bacterium]